MTAPGPERRRPPIPLDEGEKRALADIERQLRRDDPGLAGTLESASDREERANRSRLSRWLVGVGLVVALVGLLAQDGVLSVGAIVLGYGVLSIVVGAVMVARNHCRARPQH